MQKKRLINFTTDKGPLVPGSRILNNYLDENIIVAKMANLPICCCMPDSNSSILRARNYYRKLRMKTNSRNIVCVAL